MPPPLRLLESLSTQAYIYMLPQAAQNLVLSAVILTLTLHYFRRLASCIEIPFHLFTSHCEEMEGSRADEEKSAHVADAEQHQTKERDAVCPLDSLQAS